MAERRFAQDLTTPTIELLGLVQRISGLEKEVERLHAIEGPLARVGFSVEMSASMDNLATGVAHTIEFDTEIFDIGGNFNVATYTFTAPVDGIYLLAVCVGLFAVDSAATVITLRIITSNRNYVKQFPPVGLDQDVNWLSMERVVIADMEAADTARINMTITGGAAQTDIVEADGRTTFMGWLMG